MSRRPPQLSPHRLAAGLLLPLAGYLVVRTLVDSSTDALLIVTGAPAVWLLGVWIVHRRIDPVGVVTLTTTVVAVAAFALSHGDPLALELRRGAVTGPMGLAALASVIFGRPALLVLAEQRAKASPEAAARLADPAQRRFVTNLTALVGLVLTLDGLSQIVLALTIPSGSFVAASTAARIVVLGIGAIVTAWYIHDRKQHIDGHHQRTVG
jgi:hypothetical protein